MASAAHTIVGPKCNHRKGPPLRQRFARITLDSVAAKANPSPPSSKTTRKAAANNNTHQFCIKDVGPNRLPFRGDPTRSALIEGLRL